MVAEHIESPSALTIELQKIHIDKRSATAAISIDPEASSTETSVEQESKDASGPDKRLMIRESLRLAGCAIIFGGSVLIAATVVFLIFLWFGAGSTHEATNAPELWRRIALDGWTPQAVTLIAVIIRLNITCQAAVCASMLAAIMLEKRSVPKSKAVHFSVLRGVGAGPLTLMRLIASSRRLAMLLCVETVLTFLLLLGSLGLQFTSTILLSDLDTSAITSSITQTQLQTLLSVSQERMTTSTHAYSRSQPVFAVFGEVQTNATTRPDVRGYSSTGLVQRAFLPLQSSAQRAATRSYEGYSTTMSSDVACMRPNIKGLQYNSDRWDEWVDQYWGVFNGTLDYVSSLEDAGKTPPYDLESCPPLSFNCEIPGTGGDQYGWQSNLCYINGVGGTTWPGDTGPAGTTIDQPWSINSTITLVSSTNMRLQDWGSIYQANGTSNHRLGDDTAVDEGEWKSYQIIPGRFVNVSVCFNSFNLMHTYVKMAAAGNITEPVVTYDSVTGSANTSSVREHFGISSSGPSDARGILQISEIRDSSVQYDPVPPMGSTEADQNFTIGVLKREIYSELVEGLEPNITISVCEHCATAGGSLHPDLGLTIEDTLQSTGRAADAIHLHVHSIAMTIFYDLQKRFARSQEVAVSSVQPVLTAIDCRERGGCSGFTAVVTLLGGHLVIVGIITALYVTQTRFSRYSNLWHTVSQLLGEELRDIVESSHDIADKEVLRTMNNEAGNYMVKLGRSPESKRIEVLRKL